MRKMKHKQAVLDALRSGIPQAAGALGFDDGSRCCLGVMTEVAIDNGVPITSSSIPTPPDWRTPTAANQANPLAYFSPGDDQQHGTTYLLPRAVVKFFGLVDDNPSVPTDATFSDGTPVRKVLELYSGTEEKIPLSAINDAKIPFHMIADLIDRYFEEPDNEGN